MTVNTVDSIAEFVTNGVTTNFPFYFKFLASEDLVVTYVDPLGVASTLTLGTHYSVNGAGNDQGGSIVTTTALTGPGQLTVSREMEAFQQTSLRNQGKFLAETHEDVFDKLTMLIQQGFAIFKRALTRPFGRDYFFAENRRIASVKDPVEAQDAATKNWVSLFVDSVSGAINTTVGIAYDAGTLFDYLRFGVNRSVDSVAALRLLSGARNQRAFVFGYYAKGDGGGGEYFLDTTDTTSADNGGSIIVANDGSRWKLNATGFYDVKQFGAKADWDATAGTGTDNTLKIQACIDAAKKARKSTYLSAGEYMTTGSLFIDNTASTSYVDTRKIDFFGDGIHVSRIVYRGPAASCLSVVGGRTAGALPMQCFQELRNFSVEGSYVPNSYGIFLDTTQHIKLSNVEVHLFDYGIALLDVDFASFDKVIVHYNNHGIFGNERSPRAINSTRPNGIGFFGCQIAGNLIYGATFVGGACISFYGGDVEGNGHSNGPDGYGLRFENCGIQGGVGANLNGVYFEANQGVADVWILAVDAPGPGLGPNHCVSSIHACSFNRVSSDYYTNSNITASLLSSVSGKQRVSILDCSFKGYNTYPVSSARPYISFPIDPRNSFNCTVEGCVMQDDLETVPQNYNYNVSVALTLPQLIDNNTITNLNWTNEQFDSDNMHVAGSDLITIPATGKYLVTAALYWAANATGVRSALIIKNGVTEVAGDTRNAVSSGRVRQNVTIELLLVKGDTIALRGFQTSGGQLNADSEGCHLAVRSIPY